MEIRARKTSALSQLVPDVLDGLDRLREERDLLSELGDVNVDRAVDDVRSLAPDFFQDRFAGEDPAGRRKERLENAEFLRGQGDGFSLEADLVAGGGPPQSVVFVTLLFPFFSRLPAA